MTAGYDGTVRIDTSIDSKGFNAGMSRVVNSAKGAMGAISRGVKGVAVGMAKVTSAAGSAMMGIMRAFRVLAVITALIVGAFALLNNAIGATAEQYTEIQKIKDAFNELKGAAIAAFYTLFTALSPFIVQIVNFLTNIINTAAKYIAVWSGQATAMVYVGDATSNAADEAERLAKNTDKSKKAAQGALAAFDQLDVLKQTNDAATKETAPGGPVFQQVAIEQDVVNKANQIKETMTSLWTQFLDIPRVWKTNFEQAWLWLSTVFGDSIETWKTNFEQAWLFIQNLWNLIVNNFGLSWGTAVQAWAGVAAWFRDNVVVPVANYFIQLWATAKQYALDAWNYVASIWAVVSKWFMDNIINPVIRYFTDLWAGVSANADDAWKKIVVIWGVVSKWFTDNVIDPLRNMFGPALDWIREKWTTAFTFIGEFIKGVMNGVIDVMNNMINQIAGGLNSLIGMANSVGTNLPGWITIPAIAPKMIPHLAKGAVIPPNAQFMAVLGDQSSGRNIEAPEGLIRQIIQEEIGNIKADVTINFSGSLAQLVRELKPYIDKENVRIGSSLIQSGGVA